MKTKTIKRPLNKSETIFEAEHKLREKAKEISKNFVHTKPTKFLLK